MFREEARWLREHLSVLALPDAPTVLDIGSNTGAFRTGHQAHIETEIHQPLRDRGARFTTLDLRPADGVDVVADVTDPDFPPIGPFDLVLCTNLLEHVTEREQAIRNLQRATASGGHLVVSAPARFRFHPDPIDTMYRPSPQRLVRDVLAAAPSMAPVVTGTIRIRDGSSYRSRRSRLRRWVPFLSWRASAAIFRRA